MRSVVLGSLRSHTRRYVAALLAVVIGVGFVVVTAALSSAVRDGLLADLDVPYAGADVVVEKPEPDQAAALLEAAADGAADAWLVAWSIQPVALDGGDGAVVDDSADIGQLPADADRRWLDLEAGRFPEGPGEAVADPDAATGGGFGVGDTVLVGSGPDALEVEVVGLADSPTPFAAATLYLLWEDLQRWQDALYVSSVAWADPGDEDAAAEAVAAVVPDAEVLSVDAFVQQVQKEVNNQVDLVAVVVLLFATIALVVAVLVINNTFAILFAQRARDFALLRCVGATRRQVLRSVRLESAVLGCLAAVLGVAAGAAVGHGIVALVRSQWPQALLGEASIGAGWLVAAAAVGVGVTVVAAWLPTRRVVRVSPLVALRPDDSASPRTASGRLRVAAGVLAVAVGVGLLAAAALATALPVLLAGGVLTFGGVLLLGPVLVPALVRAAGPFAGRLLGPAGRLAAGNAVRNPRRAATTTASLLIGVTLTTAVLTGMASSRSALVEEMARQHPVDVALIGVDGPLPAELVDRVSAVAGVTGAAPVVGTSTEVGDLGRLPVLEAPGAGTTAAGLLRDDDRLPRHGTIVVPWDVLEDGDGTAEAGDRVLVGAGDRAVSLRVVGGEGWGAAALVAPGVLDRIDPSSDVRAIWARVADDADPDELSGSLEALARPVDAEVESGVDRRDHVSFQLDVLTAGVVGLLAIAVVIALVGIANTLGLSVLERGREHALLRALGLTRGRLRTMLAAEAVLLSVVATLLGTALGVGFAWAGVRALVQPAIDGAGLVLPWGQLAAVVGTSAVAALLAAVLPARRASRTPPAAGLALD
ncbi:ABC transporter permease [Nocardioides silvaticus]|uniref:ABC transporter permease n=1 Tax=Nocardioides silvaticus TaxID=2201891 RepID=A0A316TBW5_9ACTN|nr:ABC transporter permease [Nocardioides silvaticus]PWN01863.1 ABC transporter permease [Nocardioides silvaticus]